MKNLIIPILLLLTLLSSTVGFTSCDKNDANDTDMISTEEKATLQFMREEEKLARDVYQHFYEKYKLNIFGNITSSEQMHMDAVLTIMLKYNVPDLASSQKGVFTNTDLQKLYHSLITQGEASLAGALTVGAIIEDVDIRDLTAGIAATSNVDIQQLYNNLACGSRNHMRAFSSQLNVQGISYTPQFISEEKYNEIINGEHEQCGRFGK